MEGETPTDDESGGPALPATGWIVRTTALRSPASAKRPRAAAVLLCALAACEAPSERPYPDRVEIRRTSFGVPHILAEDLGALGYGLAWVHLEDYGRLVIERLTMARGELSLHLGEEFVESDFWWRRRYEQAAVAYPELDAEVRALYEGYAAAVNRYAELHPDAVPAWTT